MAEPPDARDGHLDQEEFRKKMMSQLQTTGVVSQVKSQLRAQLLHQLQKGQIVQLGPPPGDRPGLKRHALNSMIADYMRTVQYNYSLSVFMEESGVESRPLLTEDELLDVLKIDRETSFFQSFMKARAHAETGSDSSFIMNLVSAIAEAAAAKGKESFTQTIGGDRYQMEVRMKQLEDEYQARLRSSRMAPGAGVEERMALYRQEIEEQAAAEVARQVERIREMEVAAARLDEAAKARRAMEAERLELDHLHSERLTKLRQREEEMMDKLRRQQMDRSRVMELRSDATAELAGARAKEERLRSLETARAEAEARAAAHAADAEVCRLQAEKLVVELSQTRDELSRRRAQASDGADAMLQNAAGAMNMLNAEAVASRSAGAQIADALAQMDRFQQEAAAASAAVAALQQERAALQGALSAAGAEADALLGQLGRVEVLLDEAVAARSEALSSLEEAHFRAFQQEREVSELRSALGRAKEELAALRMQAAVRRPPSRGPDSPGRRSITLSPARRPPAGANTASISALSLGLALGGGPGGALGGGGGGHYSHYPAWQQSGGGSSGLAQGTATLSQAEFPIAAAPRDATGERGWRGP
ncbi:Oral-facial-digital syndrome 1 [Tetrabaena socialis]|uniref:Oral-facial-digital syndrome 1 n=1 Tax=Tetrabaena socialis TaxID=47790 RepID=A0A2J7ZWJ0_9CHLO|nr:Oral-facial-digital syndrome 1 [Tetrabaena socialis]|eukprot:PNH04643.1 Oral-facial-digital syndrome 1 [Tetrabaena socialis]